MEFGRIVDVGWGRCEKSLAPPDTLLDWIVDHPDPRKDARGSKAALCEGNTREKREALLRGDQDVIAEAHAALGRWRESHAPGAIGLKEWWVLEGASRPDAYIATTKAVVVIEGKRTERKPTIGTTWMRGRHQMLRHLDAAWQHRGDRFVIGMFVVEGPGGPAATKVPTQWFDFTKQTISDQALEDSLPHRSKQEREEIAATLIGVTTWQAVCATLEIPFESLPETSAECPAEDLCPPWPPGT